MKFQIKLPVPRQAQSNPTARRRKTVEMTRFLGTLLVVSLVLLTGDLCSAQDRPAPVREPVAKIPSEHQDSVRLTRVTSAVMPPDGLITIGLLGRRYSTVYILNDFLESISQQDYVLTMEAGLLPWLHLWAEAPWRTWSEGVDWVPATGSGWGDGKWQLLAARELVPNALHLALTGGGNIPMGSSSAGLAEGVYSPQVAVNLTAVFWRESNLPEMRLHLNWGRTWNRSEEFGHGQGTTDLNPWPPRYQSALAAGGDGQNDTNDLGVGLEFRAGQTSLWLEYSQQIFRSNDTVSTAEQMRMIAAGLRWGVVSGWALHGNYLVSLANDDEATPWWPGYPDLVMSLGISRQFGFGGADRDDDGVRDRDDSCPDLAEDIDGFQDEDGCPDYDNDQDGVPDVLDDAPDEPEDYDGFEDRDGAPDPDNDGDGIPDRDDLCPDDPEDFDGHSDDDGCPDEFADRDGDGVDDEADPCPDDPEDFDGFEDDDGCPEDDNDLDGIPDTEDECPDEPEDYDGDNDEDGCPDED
ncbi:MAG: hypothetical protein ACI9UQ_000275 [Candidatus Krumholzibacteriia bacterium]